MYVVLKQTLGIPLKDTLRILSKDAVRTPKESASRVPMHRSQQQRPGRRTWRGDWYDYGCGWRRVCNTTGNRITHTDHHNHYDNAYGYGDYGRIVGKTTVAAGRVAATPYTTFCHTTPRRR